MNADPVFIVDDDVDMVLQHANLRNYWSDLKNSFSVRYHHAQTNRSRAVMKIAMQEPVVIIDEDDENRNNEKTVDVPSSPTVETIDLDDETPIITRLETVNSNTTKFNKKSEVSFIINLKNNRLMDKIVTRCINMENATGMPRVVYKTLLPLYRDTNNRFKESKEFRALLKKTYKLLMRDPDHKFLHIKTLCEELKSGGLRRKVPFVTLATNVKNNYCLHGINEELTSSSREINHNNAKIQPVKAIKRNINRKKVSVRRTKAKAKQIQSNQAKIRSNQAINRIATRSVTNAEKEKTDIIDLDDSETETAPSPKNVDRQSDDAQNDDGHDNDSQGDDAQNDDDHDNDGQGDDGQNDVIIIEDTEPSDQRNDNVNTGPQETLEEDSNKENNHKNGQSLENEMDYDLLIPTNVCHVECEVTHHESDPHPIENKSGPQLVEDKSDPHQVEDKSGPHLVEDKSGPHLIEVRSDPHIIEDRSDPHLIEDINKARIKDLEMQIANDKEMIDKLEEQEVISENPYSSPYYLCSKYKEHIVQCYKKLCKLKGKSKEIVKRREIRLLVAKGHPPGPAKKLEQFLNSSIDKTGSVEFPDFADVVQCVVHSNLSENLGWNRQQVIHEAVALFRQCGQALRKQRQKREYRDLLSLIRNKKEIDDPAEKDPVLLAKLEENKLIAKVKEEEILDRYVSMEAGFATTARFGNPHVVENTAAFESDKDSSDSESESEENITIPNTTSTVNNQPGPGECSRTNVDLNLVQTNNLILTSPPINNHCNVAQSSQTNHLLVNNLIVPATAVPSTLNPMLMNLLIIPATPIYFVPNTITNQNQSVLRESSVTNDSFSNNQLGIQPTNTRSSIPATTHNELETMECSDRDRTNSKIASLLSETAISIINTNSEISLTTNINHTERQVNEPCNVTGIQENVSSTTDEVKQNCDSSKEVKIEEIVKTEPLDIQSMLDELGDGFQCQVFDIEDPFLVIEISSDESSDDEVL